MLFFTIFKKIIWIVLLYYVYLYVRNLQIVKNIKKLRNKKMTTAKQIILTAIAYKGIDFVKNNIKDYAEKSLCTENYIKNIIRKVEKENIIITKA